MLRNTRDTREKSQRHFARQHSRDAQRRAELQLMFPFPLLSPGELDDATLGFEPFLNVRVASPKVPTRPYVKARSPWTNRGFCRSEKRQ
jgi:hypothetical protein